jgi:hypothetical protein
MSGIEKAGQMGKYAQVITHKGKRILHVNAAGLPEAECLAAVEEMKQAILKEASGIMVLVDMSRLEMTTAIVNKTKEASAATKAAGIPDRPNAVVGLTGLQKAVAQLFGRGVYYTDTVEQAKERLAKEDDKRR